MAIFVNQLDAQKIKGVPVDDSAKADGKVLAYDAGTDTIGYVTGGGANINDSLTTVDNVWSASKVNTELGDKAATNNPALTGTLTLDGDVNLFRSAGNTLKTADNVVVGGNLVVQGETGLDLYTVTNSGITGAIGSRNSNGYLYQTELHNFLFCADTRFGVTLSGFTSSTPAELFDGYYESAYSNLIGPNATATITIDLTSKGEFTANGLTYPYGYIYLTFYGGTGVSELTLSGRMKDKDGAWWSLTSPTRINSSASKPIYRLTIPNKPYATVLELTLVGGPSGTQYGLVEVEWHLTRPANTALPYLEKQGASLYGSLKWKSGSNLTTLEASRDGILTFGGDTNLYRSAADVLKTDDNLLAMGSVQIGSTTRMGTNALGISKTVTNASGYAFGMSVEGTYTAGGSSSAYGMWMSPVLYGGSLVTGLYGNLVANTTPGNINGAYAGYLASLTKTGPGTVGTAVGLWVGTQTIGTNNNYTIYADGAGKSYFGGPLGVNAATPSGMLDVHVNDPTTIGLAVEGALSQTADLQQWRDSTGYVLASINAVGDLTVGNTTRDADTHIRVEAKGTRTAGFEAYGDGGTTGYVYVGQADNYGGGIFYNGDGSPAFATGESSDYVSFYRRSNGVNEVVFHYPQSGNDVTFRGSITSNGNINALTGGITANTFSGNGYSLTNLNASNLAAGTVPNARMEKLPGNYSMDPVVADGYLHNSLSAPTVGDLSINPSAYTFDHLRFRLPGSVEYTTNGTDWIAWDAATITSKKDVWSGRNKNIILLLSAGNNGGNAYQAMRFTWNIADTGLSVFLKYLYLYMSASGHAVTYKIEKLRDGLDGSGNPYDWETVFTSTPQNSWPSHHMISHPSIAFGPTLASHWQHVRLTMTPTWNSAFPNNNITLYMMQWYCTHPSGGNGHHELYTWDFEKNVNFTGNVGVGQSAAAAKIHLPANTTKAGGILFGPDTNLYRYQANALRTDDHFTVGDGVTIGTVTAAPALTVNRTMGQPNIQLTGDYGIIDAATNNGMYLNYWQNKPLTLNYAGGNVKIGNTTVDSGKLNFPDHTTAAGGIALGSDVGLHRSGVETIRTTGHLQVAKTLRVEGGSADADFSTATLDVVGALFRIGDTAGTATFPNGLGIKFADAGEAHASIKWDSTAKTMLFGRSSVGAGLAIDADQLTLALDVQNNRVGIGNISAPTAALSLPNGSTAVSGIAFGTDVNLYRSGANVLKTDDTLTVGGSLLGVSATFSGGITNSVTSQANTALPITLQKRGNINDANGSVLNGAELGYMSFYGWDGTSYGRGAYLISRAAEDYSTTAHGTSMSLYVTNLQTTAPLLALWMAPSGRVGVGTSLSGELQGKLNFPVDTTAANGIYWGGDTNLYRSAADTLTTDDSLFVNGTFKTTGSSPTQDFLGLFVRNGIVPQSSAVAGNTGNMVSVQGSGSAFFMGRDVTNAIEFIMGTSSAGCAFAGAMTAHDLQLRTNNNPRLTIKKDSGHVGIGNTDPGARLQVDTLAATVGLIVRGAAAQAANLIECKDNANTTVASVDAAGNLSAANTVETIGVTVDGSGSVLTAANVGVRQVHAAGTILSWTLVTDLAGDVEFTVAKAAYADYPVTTTLGTCSVTGAQKASGTVSWAVAADDLIEFSISGTPATATRATLLLKIKR